MYGYVVGGFGRVVYVCFDVVFVVDLVVIVVVHDDICCVCVHAYNGDILVYRKAMVVWRLGLAEWSGEV